MLKHFFKYFEKSRNWGVPLLIALCCLISGIKEKGWDQTFINGDGKGYYAYLPAVFIYHDLSFGFIETYEKEHYQPGQLCDFRQPVEGGIVDRYYVGTAVAQLPFFIVTHSICKLTGWDSDGYSRPYQYTVLIAACFYLFIGLWALFSFLGDFCLRPIRIAFTLTCIVFGTPLLFYTIYNPDFSHIYSFAFVSLFVMCAHRFFSKPEKQLIYLLAFLLGMIAIIRPVNLIIVLALPFLASGWQNFIAKIKFVFKDYATLLLPAILIFAAISFIQLLIYYLQTGNFIVYSYGDAGFDFLHPNFINFLFSYRKGMFLYTPLLFISMGGFIFLFKENKYRFVTLLLFLIAVVYALSSWKVWTYGMTYGQRPIIEYYFVFAILLSYILHSLSNKVHAGIAISILTLTIAHNLLQMSQHRHYILHWDEMTREKYWKVFLRTDPLYYGYLWNPLLPILEDTVGYKAASPAFIKNINKFPATI
ncbi:MAG TPA: hypothetical protein VHO90_14875, partial [Bacteroidales bacterium]|nr:hypothetical protein [Bacteroidales bacterium]